MWPWARFWVALEAKGWNICTVNALQRAVAKGPVPDFIAGDLDEELEELRACFAFHAFGWEDLSDEPLSGDIKAMPASGQVLLGESTIRMALQV